MFEEEIKKILKKITGLKEIVLEIPPDDSLGDYSFPCFGLAKQQKRNPTEIASELKNKIKKTNSIEKIEIKGPYLNFFVNKQELAGITIRTILKQKEKYGSAKDNKKIVIESPGPNTNKPLHLGHLRNMALGLSLSKIYKKRGNKVINVDIINDRGIHICKSMLAYKKFGNNKKPNKKPDHFVGDFYILFNKKESKELEEEAINLLRKWENKDKEAIKLWKKMNSWAIKGINETYKKFGIKIDNTFFESHYYIKGKDIALEGLRKGIFEKDNNGAIIVNLEKEGLGKKVLLREDGTSVYITQDIYLAIKRYQDFKMDKMIYIVASEQIHHFKVLFAILKILGYSFAKDYYHLPYGMIYLPEGKMKSREGKIVDADNLIRDVTGLTRKEIVKRDEKISRKELEKRAEIIGLGAIKFFILNYDPLKDFVYHPEESLSFEGETGPYIQYAHARISSVLRKTKKINKVGVKGLTTTEEIRLIKLLSDYPRKIQEAATQYKPSIISNYLFDLAQSFNTFYSKYPILKSEENKKIARLNLISCIKIVLKDGLGLLGIEAPERM